MKIDKIIPYGKTRSKVLFDEGLVLIFYNGELKRYRLEEGGELSTEQYEKLFIPLFTKRARERLVYILKNSDKTESELRRKLKDGFYPEPAIDAAIDWAKSKHYIDDRRFADTYIRYHSEGSSRKKIMYDLMNKGLNRQLVSEMLDEADIDESDQIKNELEKRHYSDEMDEKEKKRIISALLRKGYSWHQISANIANASDVC